MKDLGGTIRQLRICLALSQGELAEIMGIKQDVLSRWELNKVKPSMKSIRKLAETLEVDVKELTKRY